MTEKNKSTTDTNHENLVKDYERLSKELSDKEYEQHQQKGKSN